MLSGRRPKAILGSAFLLTLTIALAACGGSGSSSTSQASTSSAASATAASTSSTSSTPSTSTTASTTTATSSSATEKVPTLSLTLSSPVTLSPLPKRYTCDGSDTTPAVNWGKLPTNTVEVDLFLFNLLPVHGKLFNDWAVAGLKPKLSGVSTGRLPAGAILGRNSYRHLGYNVCPPKGQSVHYAFLVYALPKRISVKTGFNAEALREKALHTAEFAGLLGASYKRA
jgi:phosphatidylethanolamine-binding protein (PEBP) family uncharacterized protein